MEDLAKTLCQSRGHSFGPHARPIQARGKREEKCLPETTTKMFNRLSEKNKIRRSSKDEGQVHGESIDEEEGVQDDDFLLFLASTSS